MRRVSILCAAFVAVAAGAFAQTQVMPPLGEVARQAEAAKANTKKAKKTYTNSDLSADLRGEPAPAAVAVPAAVSSNSAKPEPAKDAAPAGATKVGEGPAPKESEETWRMRATSLRKQVDQLRARLEELQASSAARAENPAVKALNDRDIANTRTGLDALMKQWTRLESSARELKVPAGWIEPAPAFPQ